MEQESEDQQNQIPSTRAYRRFVVDENATLLFVDLALPQKCRMVDLSLEGCRLRSLTPLRVRVHSRVEILFKVNGVTFRLGGTVQWAEEHKGVGIHFHYPTPRRRAELAELLGEVEEAVEAKAAKEAAEKLAAELATASDLDELEEAQPQAPASTEGNGPDRHDQPAPPERPTSDRPALVPRPEELRPPTQPTVEHVGSERRTQTRYEVDTSAVILLINVGSRLSGHILDLSRAGCSIRTDERFPVGIYTRVETEFRFRGESFRLGGVVQAIHDRRVVGIRFLDLSDRKREQVRELIDEIEKMRASQLANSEDSGA
jgi:PilZ domain